MGSPLAVIVINDEDLCRESQQSRHNSLDLLLCLPC